jgi:hypothetical protein
MTVIALTGPPLTTEQLMLLDAGELLALMAGVMALRVRTPEDVELLDALGREFRRRNEPGGPDTDVWCARCELPFVAHDEIDNACPDDDTFLGYFARPHIFGMDEVA